MANYTHNEPTISAHKNVFVVEGEDTGGRRFPPREEPYTNMQIPYARGRIVNLGKRGRVKIIDDGEVMLGEDGRDKTPYTQWKCVLV